MRPRQTAAVQSLQRRDSKIWPYSRSDNGSELPEEEACVNSVREYFLDRGCTSGKSGAAEAAWQPFLDKSCVECFADRLVFCSAMP